MTTTDTPRTDAIEPQLHSNVGGWVRADFARQLELELAHSLENQVKAQAEVKEIRAALGDDGRRTHKEVLELATKASQWREWKKKYIDLRNAHIAEGQDPAGTIWEHADKLQKELNASKAEVAELKQQKRNCLEIIDDDAKERSELKAEVERLKKDRYPFQSFVQFCNFLTSTNLIDELAVSDPEGWDGGAELSRIEKAFDQYLDETNK